MAQHGNWCHRNLSRETISIPKKENFPQVAALVVPELGEKFLFSCDFKKKRRRPENNKFEQVKSFSAPAHSPTPNMHPNKMKLGKQKNNKSLCGPIHGHILRMLHAWNKKRKNEKFFSFWTEFVFSFVGTSTSWVTLVSFESTEF